MPHLSPSLTLIDLVVVVVVVLGVAAALRRRSGLLGAVGAGVAALVLSWVALAALSAWAPPSTAHAVDRTRLLHAVPVPHRALHDAHQIHP